MYVSCFGGSISRHRGSTPGGLEEESCSINAVAFARFCRRRSLVQKPVAKEISQVSPASTAPRLGSRYIGGNGIHLFYFHTLQHVRKGGPSGATAKLGSGFKEWRAAGDTLVRSGSLFGFQYAPTRTLRTSVSQYIVLQRTQLFLPFRFRLLDGISFRPRLFGGPGGSRQTDHERHSDTELCDTQR
jgi:hypothetical protein